MPRVVHFEISVDDIERAKKFYNQVFGWEFPKWLEEPPYWGVMTAPEGSTEPGINGGLLQRSKPVVQQGSNAYICTIQVDDFDAYAKKIIDAGGQIAMPKYALVGMAWQGYFLDTEGNTLGLHQADKEAK